MGEVLMCYVNSLTVTIAKNNGYDSLTCSSQQSVRGVKLDSRPNSPLGRNALVFLGLGDETGNGSMSDIMTQTQDDYAAQNDLIWSLLMRTVLVYVQGALRKLCACGGMCCSHPSSNAKL